MQEGDEQDEHESRAAGLCCVVRSERKRIVRSFLCWNALSLVSIVIPADLVRAMVEDSIFSPTYEDLFTHVIPHPPPKKKSCCLMFIARWALFISNRIFTPLLFAIQLSNSFRSQSKRRKCKFNGKQGCSGIKVRVLSFSLFLFTEMKKAAIVDFFFRVYIPPLLIAQLFLKYLSQPNHHQGMDYHEFERNCIFTWWWKPLEARTAYVCFCLF